MNKLTKILIPTLGGIVIATGIGITIAEVVKAKKPLQDDYCYYKKLEDGTYEAISSKQTGNTIDIPATFKGQKVTSIGTWFAFNNKTVETVKIPSSVKTINSLAFMNCEKLKTISFKESNESIELTKIGTHAFCGCINLKVEELPSSLHTIEAFAFQNCRAITNLYIPKSVVLVGIDAFNGCSNAIFLLQSTSVPSGWNAKWNSSNRPFITDWDSELKIYSYTNTDNVVYNFIPYVNQTAFIISAENYKDISGTITIPTTVSRNDAGTTITYNVMGLNENCFAKTTANAKVNTIVINSSMTLNEGCFAAFTCASVYSTPTLDSAWITNFESNSNGGKVYSGLSQNITLDSTTNLNYVLTNDSKAIIVSPDSAFITQSAEIPAQIASHDVIEIAPRAFRGFEGFTTLTFKCATCVIRDYAFYDCRSLKNVILDNVTSIGNHSFAVSALRSVDDNGVTNITAASNKLVSIGKNAFEKPYYHKTTPEKYTEITTNIFANGNTITTIGNSAFKNCVFANNSEIYFNDGLNKLTGYEFNHAGYDPTYDPKTKEHTYVVTFKVSQALFNKMKANPVEGGWGWKFEDKSGYYLLTSAGSMLGVGQIVVA